MLVAAGKGEEMSGAAEGFAEAEGADDENMGGATRGCHPLIAALRVKSPSPKKSPGVKQKSQEGDS